MKARLPEYSAAILLVTMLSACGNRAPQQRAPSANNNLAYLYGQEAALALQGAGRQVHRARDVAGLQIQALGAALEAGQLAGIDEDALVGPGLDACPCLSFVAMHGKRSPQWWGGAEGQTVRRNWPPTSNRAWVICPSEQTRTADSSEACTFQQPCIGMSSTDCGSSRP